LLLDTTYNIATPEGVELRLPLAGLAPRSLAWLIDALIKTVALTIAAIALGFLGKLGTGITLVAAFLLLWFYNVLFEVFNHGATPGKNALGIRVTNINGTPVGWSGALLRNLIRVVDTLPGCYAFGCISVLVNDKFQRLGDLAAGTIVVYQPQESSASGIDEIRTVPVRVPLTLDEQQAIVGFGERAAGISSERSEELAALLTPLFADTDATRLRGHANWLAGRDRAL